LLLITFSIELQLFGLQASLKPFLMLNQRNEVTYIAQVNRFRNVAGVLLKYTSLGMQKEIEIVTQVREFLYVFLNIFNFLKFCIFCKNTTKKH
jgi:hypothetical protein